MIRFDPPDHLHRRPAVQMTAAFAILAVGFLLFMGLGIFSVSRAPVPVPPAAIAMKITKDGAVIVNRKRMSLRGLTALLNKTSKLYPGHAVVVSAELVKID